MEFDFPSTSGNVINAATAEIGDNDNDSNNSGDILYSTPLSRLVNLPFSSSISPIIPGPFVVLQGSPGDGMANTIDSMPVLPPSVKSTGSSTSTATSSITTALNTAAPGSGSRRNSIEDRIPSRVLEELESEVSDESDEGVHHIIHSDEGGHDSSADNDDDGADQPTSALSVSSPDSKPRASSFSASSTAAAITRRPRSDSDTEGGLHLPLGPSSPIMRKVHYDAASSLTSTFLSSGATVVTREEEVAIVSVGLPLVDNGDDDKEEEEGTATRSESGNDTRFVPLLKRRPTGQPKSTGEEEEESSKINGFSSCNGSKRRNTNGDTNETEESPGEEEEAQSKQQQEVAPNEEHGAAAAAVVAAVKPPEEIQAINQWSKECIQQELSHLEEFDQNVKLLIQRRKQTRDQQQQRMAASSGTSLRGNGNRSVSPVGTATSGSSSGTSDSASLSLRAKEIPKKKKEEEIIDPFDKILHALELANAHRTWYQNDGKLVVLKSLPHMSLHQSGVVAHPVTSKSLSSSRIMSTTTTGTPGAYLRNDKGVVTLAPGCTVMAEAAYILDSRTLRQVYPPLSNTRRSNLKSDHDEVDSTAEATTDPTLAFLKISSPHNGYILSSIHSYPLLLPGLPTTYTDTAHWLWRVTCQPDGAYIRRGLELVTEHLGTLSYGMVCEVEKKVVNGMGLNRLQIEAYLEKKKKKENHTDGGESEPNDDNDDVDTFGMKKYSGYISEFLNPLSGQRGNVVEQIPFPVPAQYKVTHSKGCVIRSGVELSTTQIGFAPPGSILSIVGRSYSDHPGHNCIERLKLAGGGGWISVTLNKRPPGNETLVEMLGVDGNFDPNDPSKFHFDSMRRVMEELHANNGNQRGNNGAGAGNGSGSHARTTFRRLSSYADLSEIGDDDAIERSSLSSMPDNEAAAALSSSKGGLGMSPGNATTAVPTLFRSGVVGGLGVASSGLPAMDAIRESSSDNHHHNSCPNNRCLICLSDERTATIVHGETGHIACCLTCARILKARGDNVSLFCFYLK